MSKNVTLMLVLFFLISSKVFAQSNSAQLSGQIVYPDHSPASFVTVSLKNNGAAATTNEKGQFVIRKLPYLEDTLLITGIGIVSFKQYIKIANHIHFELGIITIKEAQITLQNIEITGRVSRSYKSDYSFVATKTQTSLIDIPQSVSTVTKELINDKMQMHLNKALENIAGVTHYSGYEEYNIRGLHAENARLINGLRTFNTSLTSPLLVNVERVELIKGPAAVLYGNCDPGGTINLVTKKPLSEKHYTAFISAGNWNAFNAEVDATGPLKKNAGLLYRINAGYENTKSFRNGYFLKTYQLAPSFTFIPNKKLKLNLDISIAHTNTVADRGQPALEGSKDLLSTPVNLTIIQPSDYLKESNLSAVLSATWQIKKNISFNTSLLYYYTQQLLSEHGIADFITRDSVYLNYTNKDQHTGTGTFSNYFSFLFNKGEVKHQLLAGYDHISNTLTAEEWEGKLFSPVTNDAVVGTFSLLHPQYFKRDVNAYQHITDTAAGNDVANGLYTANGFYLQEYLTYRRWQLTAGLRAEFFAGGDQENGAADGETEVNKILPRLGITYSVKKDMRIYASYNSGFDPFEPTSVTQVFDQPFKPVTSSMIETGIKTELLKNKLFSSLAIYQININNLAVNANNTSNPDLFVQRGKQRSRGIEWELQGKFFKNLSADFNYAFNQTEIIKSIKKDEIGRIAENAPKHSSGSWIKYEFEKGTLNGWGISLGHTQAGKRNTLDAEIILPGYAIYNAGINYEYKNFKLAVTVNNLFNCTYWASAYNNLNKWPGPPRNFNVRVYYNLR